MRDRRPGVVITGIGVVSPIGVGVPSFVGGLRAGRSGVRAIDPHERVRSSAAAVVAGFDAAAALGNDAEVARVPRLVPMALRAAREALDGAGLRVGGTGKESRRTGVVLGTGAGGIDFTLDQAQAGLAGRRPSLWTITNATHGNLAGELSIRLVCRGPSLCVSTGCASSSDAAGLAMDVLRSARPGSPDAVIVVGADAHVRWETLLGMELLRVISTRAWSDRAADPRDHPASASRPFDRSRDGFILGEGAWAAVFEREDAARARGAAVMAEALGYGATCDAYHRVRPAPDAEECARAMRDALADAALDPSAVGLVQYHGTSTRVNDALETAAVRAAFGAHAGRLRGSSIKSMIGHPQGACGMASLVAMVGAISGADGGAGFVPPTINLREPDPACDLDYTPNSAASLEPGAAHAALINCLAFGAKNSALVIRAVSPPC